MAKNAFLLLGCFVLAVKKNCQPIVIDPKKMMTIQSKIIVPTNKPTETWFVNITKAVIILTTNNTKASLNFSMSLKV